ncbi:MAG TPA: MoxR family ATPase [Planctomycetota bacterium]|nr:MoxR family ATPase [Planctomycetota bacterium]
MVDELNESSGQARMTDLQAVEKLNASYKSLRQEIAKVIVGQEHVLEEILIAIFCRGHCLLVGVPGLAKTLIVRTLAEVLSLAFKRIQFTPDLMPADITGTEILQETDRGERVFRFMHGPIFANIILADEINRTPPKTQAALLEAMQEHRVTCGNRTFSLEEPFFVLATQNPIEQEGTYPLPEAQLDRFMFNILVDYPQRNEEIEIMKTTTTAHVPHLDKMLSAEEIIELQEIVRRVPVADHVYEYAVDLAIGTRPLDDVRPFIREWVSWGAGPRASQYLILGAKARAILNGRYHATTEDVRAVALPVLRHRVITNFNAESEGVTSDSIIKRLLEETPVKTAR